MQRIKDGGPCTAGELCDRGVFRNLEDQSRALLLGCLFGDRSVKISSLRMLGLSPTHITKLNARHMQRSLAQVIKIGGSSGLLVAVDDMEILVSKSRLEPLHYTRVKREDAYESIRQLIDEIDSLHAILFLFGFDRELLDQENAGIKSYQALWMRIQNEIVSPRFNRFTEIVDLDQLGRQIYTRDVVVRLSAAMAETARQSGQNACPLDEEAADRLLEKAKTSAVGIPALVKEETLKEGTEVKRDV